MRIHADGHLAGNLLRVLQLVEQGCEFALLAELPSATREILAQPVVQIQSIPESFSTARGSMSFDAAHELGHLVMHADAEPGSRIVEDQAHRFAAEFLMPADQIRHLLPRTTTGKGWAQLAELKEHWGVSIAALLYRARALGVMSDVTYRNAMISISQKGWRRAEPGKVSILEMPSLLPKAIHVLEEAGISAEQIVDVPGFPRAAFRVISSRTPTR